MLVQRRRRWQQLRGRKVLMPWISCDEIVFDRRWLSRLSEYLLRMLHSPRPRCDSTRPWVPWVWFIYGVSNWCLRQSQASAVSGSLRHRRRRRSTRSSSAFACVLFVACAFPAPPAEQSRARHPTTNQSTSRSSRSQPVKPALQRNSLLRSHLV